MSSGFGANSVPAPRLSITPSGGLMSTLKLDPKAAGAGFRRQATSNSSPFPFDVPVIGWKSKSSDSEMEQVRLQTVIRHSGWLFKRAQVTLDSKRWFVLENNRLYSYMREDYLDDDTVDPVFFQFPSSIRAVIDLDHCSVKVLTKQKMLLEIQCAGSFCWSKKGNFFSDLGTGRSSSSKTFTFYAEDDTSFQSWVDVLARVEAYKRLKYHLQMSSQPRPEPLMLWDLSKESLLRIFCRMQDDKPEFKFFQTKWSALREEDVMFYRRVVLLLNGSHQRAMDRHKQVALQEWEVNNSWKEVFEHITLNKLTSEPVIEVEYPKIEMKLPAENSTLVLKVKERMEIFSDYKAMPRTFLRSLKDLQELKLERLVALADIENWLMLVEPFVTKFAVKSAAVKAVKPSRTVSAPVPPVIIESDEDIEFAKCHMDRAVEYVDILLGQLGSSLLLEDGPICEKGMFKKMYMSVIIKLIEAKMLEEKLKETTMTKELKDAAFALIDIDDEFSNPPISAPVTDDVDDNGNPIPMASKAPKDAAHAPELFSDWEGGAVSIENLSFVTFFVKVHGLASSLLKMEFELQSYFGRIYENLLKKDKTSDEVKGFRPSTMKKEEDVQHLPVNGHVQTVAFRSLKTKVGESVRTDSILQKISSFITVGSFSAHALKFKGCKGYDGELLKLSKHVQSFEAHLTDLYKHSELWLRTIGGDEAARRELESRSDHMDGVDATVSGALTGHLISNGRDAKMKKQFDGLASDVWKLFIAGKNDVSIPAIVKARADCVKRRAMSVSQALASFAEVIMCQIKTFFHGSCPDFWHILDLIGAFTLTVSCLVSVFHDEMGMLDDTYNACRWVIDRRLMIRLKLMPFNLQTEQDSDFFWTLCEDLDGSGSKSSRNPSDNTSAYNMRFRSFPCEKKEASGSSCLCRVCKSHPLPLWDETSESRYDEDSSFFQSFRDKATPSDFLQPVLVIHIRKKYWDKIPSFMVDPSDPTHLRFDYPLFPIFNNVGINENQRRAAAQAPSNFLMQNRVNTDAAAVFTKIIDAVEHNAKAMSPNPSLRRPLQADDLRESCSSPRLTWSSSSRTPEAEDFYAPPLIYKKLRPSHKSAGPTSSAQFNVMEDPPVYDDDHVSAIARWPSVFSDSSSNHADSQQLLTRLKSQIVDACTRCRQACYETRKVTKDMAAVFSKASVDPAGNDKKYFDFIPEDDLGAESIDASEAPSGAAFANAAGQRDAAKDSQSSLQMNLAEPPIEQLEDIGDISRRMLGSGRIVMCKSAKDRTSMYVTYDQCRFLQEEHDPGNANGTKEEFMDLVQRIRMSAHDDALFRRTDGTRIHNVRKNVHTSTYAFNRIQGMLLPKNYKPPTSRMAWGVQS